MNLWERVSGPGSARLEKQLNIGWMICATFLFVLVYFQMNWSWTIIQFIVMLIFVIDISGGISVNASKTGKSWWHRSSQTWRHHFLFLVFHIHPLILAFIFPTFAFSIAVPAYLLVLIGGAAILFAPRLVQTPIAFIVYTFSLIISILLFDLSKDLIWFLPLYYLKLFLAYLTND